VTEGEERVNTVERAKLDEAVAEQNTYGTTAFCMRYALVTEALACAAQPGVHMSQACTHALQLICADGRMVLTTGYVRHKMPGCASSGAHVHHVVTPVNLMTLTFACTGTMKSPTCSACGNQLQ
jgi:hypothetical protein